MAESKIPVDLFNPGQVFACLGFVEAANELLGGATGVFDWTTPTTVFLLHVEGKENPAKRVLDFLKEAKAYAVVSDIISSDNERTKRNSPEDVYPVPYQEKDSPICPVILENLGKQLAIYHWADDKTKCDTVKFWAGNTNSLDLTQKALLLISECLKKQPDTESPFDLCVPQSSSFRFDWRRDYIPIDIGFSLNFHKNDIATLGFPVVEILAAIGLSHARPKRIDKLTYDYGVLGCTNEQNFLEPLFLRAALGCAKLPFVQRHFRMHLGWPGKEGQARCITSVTEE